MQLKANNEKRLYINKLQLPIDLLDNIKSFVFYDETHSPAIRKIFLYKNLTIKIFERSFHEYDMFVLRSGHWGFTINHSPDDPALDGWLEESNDPDVKISMQAVNCIKCGNYYYEYLRSIIRDNIHHCRIICQCVPRHNNP